MKKFLILIAGLTMLQCATYRMSEEKQKAITAQPHGMLEIKLPNGKQIDGYDEKWQVLLHADGEALIKDGFGDDEAYKIPMKAGKRQLILQVRREISRPFRIGYRYVYANYLFAVDIEENKTTKLNFEVPEKSLSVGMVILGVIVPILPIIAWPIGDWPTQDADLKPVIVMAAAETGPKATGKAAKTKGK